MRNQVRSRGLDAVPALKRLLSSPSAFARWEAINLLGELRDEASLSTIAEFALAEKERHAAWRALWALSRFDSGKTVPLLLQELDGPPGYRRWRAALALTMNGRQEAGEVLLEELDGPDEWRVWEALSGIRALRLEGAAKKVTEFVDHDRPRAIRQQAVLALGAIAASGGHGKSTKNLITGALERALDDPHPQVRWRASMALTMAATAWADERDRILKAAKSRLRIESEIEVIRQLENDIRKLGGGS